MQIENDYDKEVYNGDIGYIDDVDPNDGELTASFDGRTITYGFGELDTLVLAYATTIHKSQGSEYPAVVIPVMTQHYAMLQRNLLYTGVTRGKKLVVLVGQKKAVAIAVRNVSGRRRWSKLSEWLASKNPSFPIKEWASKSRPRIEDRPRIKTYRPRDCVLSSEHHAEVTQTHVPHWGTSGKHMLATSVSQAGAERKCWHGSLPAAIGGNAENLCSSRAFLRLIQTSHCRVAI